MTFTFIHLEIIMKTKFILSAALFSFLFATIFSSCSKSSSSPSNNGLSSLNGTWQTTVWGGANDTAKATINSSSATGSLVYLSTGAQATQFSVGDMIYSNIKATGNNSFSCTGTYRYTAASGATNGTVGTTSAVITLQNNTTMYVHYSKDAASGITPPDYYWYKQ